MSRESYSPRAPLRERVVPIAKGGTSADKSTSIADSLSLVTNAQKGQANGTIPLDAGGKAPASLFGSANGTNKVNVVGNFTQAAGTTAPFQITDFDSFRSYNVSVNAGSVVVNGDTINFTAPSSTQTVTLTVNGRTLSISVLGSIITQPSIAAPVNGSSGLSAQVNFTGSAFSNTGNPDTHASSDWQVATDAAFNNIVSSVALSTTDKTTWTSGNLSASSTFYARVRYKGTSGSVSAWSPTISFSTKADYSLTTEEAKLTVAGLSASDFLGSAISITSDGTRVLMGAPQYSSGIGRAYIFLRTGNTWALEATISSYTAGVTAFGTSVAISGDGTRAVIGAPQVGSNAGTAVIYIRSGSTWTLETNLNASIESTLLAQNGYGVAIDETGTRVAIAPRGNSTGYFYIFLRTGVTWTKEFEVVQQQTNASSRGGSVAITADGARVAMGVSTQTVSTIASAGSVFIYIRSGTTWTLEQQLTPSDPISGGRMGRRVAFNPSGTKVIAGADQSTESGNSAYIFTRSGSTWTQEAKLLTGGSTSSGSTTAVAISADGNNAYVGSPRTDPTAATRGCVFVFTFSGGSWAQTAKLLSSVQTVGQWYGGALSISSSNNRLAIGIDDGATVVGGCWINM